jgi:phosphatidate phosphatase APP1
MRILHGRIEALAPIIPFFALVACQPARVFGGSKPTWIDLYGGWASQNGGHLYARVHTGSPPKPDTEGENAAEKLLASIEALELEAAANAAVTIDIPGKGSFETIADNHGFIDFTLPAGMKGPFNPVSMTLVASPDFKSSSANYAVPVWADEPGHLGVISDVDDTLTDSDIPNKTVAGYRTLFHSAYDVKVFPSAGETLTSITTSTEGLPVRPLFFLTGSPWNLHTRIASAFAMAGIPKGAFILRRFSREPVNAYEFKHPHLQELFEKFPQTKWLLFGDTGEQDPEVYHQMSIEKPQQIEHIYIHNVPTKHEDPRSHRFAWTDVGGHPQRMTVFDDWSSVSTDVEHRGYAIGDSARGGAQATPMQ